MKKLIFLLLMVPALGNAQKYVAEAPLSAVPAGGFYKIPLPPRVTALVTSNFSNFRVVDETGLEVPYITMIERLKYNNVEWKEFKIEKEITKACCTKITLINPDKKTIDNFLLQVKNADVTKTAVLRGSDDGETWYALREKFQLGFGSFNGRVVTEIFDFPLSDYAYYQLTINDSTTSPLNVLGAWQTSESIIEGRYSEIPAVTMTSADSTNDHATWAIIHFDSAQYINKLEFEIGGPHLYRRRADIFRRAEYFDRKKRKRTSLEPIGSFDVISGQTPLALIAEKEGELLVRIDNENNQPLKFKGVRAFQLKQSIITYLESDHQYKLVFGDDDLPSPVYDLEYFRDSIPAKPSEVEIGKLNNLRVLEEATSPTYFTNRNIIWVAIFMVIAILGFMSARMLRDKNLN